MTIAEVMQAIQKTDAKITAEHQLTIRNKKFIRQLQRQHTDLTNQLANLHKADGFTPKDKSDTSGVEFRKPKPVKESTTVMTPQIPTGSSGTVMTPIEEAIQAYCTKCKTKRPVQNGNRVVTKSGKHGLKGTCGTCGSKLFRFIKKN